VGLPFTSDQFFGIFAEYNNSFWCVAVALWLASAAALAAVWRNPTPRSRWLTLLLAILWMWNAVAYHAHLFTRINPAAWLFAGLFAAQAILFLWAGTRREIVYFSSGGSMRGVGIGLACYALAYPVLNLTWGHGYPATPTFGVPCPTAILTIGVLLTVRGGVPVALAVIPTLWGFVGGSAARLLGVPADYILLGAGVLLAATLMRRPIRSREWTVVRSHR
jgi:hypothetical protein